MEPVSSVVKPAPIIVIDVWLLNILINSGEMLTFSIFEDVTQLGLYGYDNTHLPCELLET